MVDLGERKQERSWDMGSNLDRASPNEKLTTAEDIMVVPKVMEDEALSKKASKSKCCVHNLV